MTPEQRALFQKSLSKFDQPAPAAPAAAPPRPAVPKQRPAALMNLIQGLPPEMREAFVPALSDPATRTTDPSKILGDVGRTLDTQEQVRQLDLPRIKSSPDEVPREELDRAMVALEKEGWLEEVTDPQPPQPANADRATVGTAEFGTQPRKNLRLMPLQKLGGMYGVSANAMKQALVLKYFKRMQQREALPGVDKMTPEQYQQTLARAEEEATRFVSGVVGASEAEGNMLVPLESVEDRALAIRRGDDLPAPMKLLMAGPLAGMKLREYLTGTKVEDQATSALMAPLWALTRPGQVATPQSLDDLLEGGKPVEREGKFSWMTRLGPLSAFVSWFADPELSWELGGEKGLGGQQHIEKVVGGYDIMRELPRLGEAYASITPWEDSRAAKTIAAAVPLGAAILMEPDAISIGSGLLAAPLSKAAKEAKLGKAVLSSIFAPALDSWAKILEETGDIEKVAEAAGRPGTPTWLLFQALKGDLLARGFGEGARVDRLNPNDLSGFEAAMAAALKEVQEASTDTASQLGKVQLGGAELGANAADAAAKTGAAQAAGAERVRKAEEFVSEAQHKALQELQPVIIEATKARRAFDDAEAEFVGMARLRNVEGDAARPGGQAKAPRDTTEILAELARMKEERASLLQQLEIAKAADKTDAPAREAERQARTARTLAARTRLAESRNAVAQARNAVAAELSKAAMHQDARKLQELRLAVIAAEEEFAKAADAAKAAEAAFRAPQVSEVQRIEKALASHKSPLLENVTELINSHITTDYMRARKVLADQIGKLGRARARVARMTTGEAALREAQAGGRTAREVAGIQARAAARAAKITAALDAALLELNKAFDLEQSVRRQQAALARMPASMGEAIDHYRQGVRFSLDSIRRGTTEAPELGRSVVDDLAEKTGRTWSVDGDRYYAGLVARYGAESVQGALSSPGSRWVAPFLSGTRSATAATMRELRRFEEAAHNAAEVARRAPGQEIRGVLRTVGESPLARGWSRESWIAWTYQAASRLGRNTDRVSASIIGKAPRSVQALVRRAYGRYQATELELDQAAAEGGIAAMREFLTSGTAKFGTVSNQDTMTIADKALAYMRALAAGADEVWSADVVIDALSRAPLPSWFEGSRAAGNTRGALRSALQDHRMTGASLVRWLENVPPGIFSRQLGTADASQVQFRFISRALIQASNQHDAMYDIMRLAGPGITAASARSLNFMISRNIVDLVEHEGLSMASAARAADAFGLPFLSTTAGKLQHLFRANHEQVRLLHAATIEGKEHWIPYTLWRALNEVPFKLSKELEEFSKEPTWLSSGFDKISRLWRIATVNGWVLPRAAHFTNTLFGDWSQMVQALGWRRGTRLALQSLPTYVPFVGRALQDRLTGSKNTMLNAMFNPELATVLRAGTDYVVDTADGPVTARRFLQEAWEDGCWDSISTRDLQDATARHAESFWKKWTSRPPPWIERSAKMMEEVQKRNRLALYLELRNGGLGREAARSKLNEALYDWSTGVPEWEMQSVSRIAAFWTYRRSMLRQLGGSLTEAFTTPAAEFWPKALTGRTKVARMRQMAQLVGGIPDAIYWEDPDEQIDDAEQYHRYALHSAPWWVKAQAIIANRVVDPQRKLWYSEVAGRDVTYESLMLPALTTMDQLYLLNLFIQTSMATTVMAAEKAGMQPSMTTIDAREIWERNVDAFSDTMMPGFDEATNNLLRGIVGREKYNDPRGVLVPQAQAVLLHRSGFGSFMAAQPDADGSWRIDPGAYGLFTSLVMAFPPAADFARNWVIFADNPGYQSGVGEGLAEGLQRWVGFKPAGFNPAASRDYEVDDQARKLKEEASKLRKQTEPKRAF